jgi:hypothetical protein
VILWVRLQLSSKAFQPVPGRRVRAATRRCRRKRYTPRSCGASEVRLIGERRIIHCPGSFVPYITGAPAVGGGGLWRRVRLCHKIKIPPSWQGAIIFSGTGRTTGASDLANSTSHSCDRQPSRCGTRGHLVLRRAAYIVFLSAVLFDSFFITLWLTEPQVPKRAG